jgi:hypothetical protein
MRLPSLSCGDAQSDEAYRLIGVPGFANHPIVVSVVLIEGVWSVQGAAFQSSTELIAMMDATRVLSQPDVLRLVRAIQQSRLWTTNEPWMDGFLFLDGGPLNPSWTLEARRDHSYQAVRRAFPDEEPFQTLGEVLVALGDLPYSITRTYPKRPSALPPIPAPQ